MRHATLGTDDDAVEAIRCAPDRTDFVRWPLV
ncbi:putative glycosyl hydrolase [Streptomyces viridochromogenes Tue57]|uniref:Putative glycosyl hydrolase n=1 Tax=Streptomyces viridochromogenes Tue57 TaxID=1160705 RepID=L8PMT0_STRVR|nr:putative glycosyl hydrolase [Streptomyces viridochromogenes Tue57]